MSRATDHLRRHPGIVLSAAMLGVALVALGWGVHAGRQETLRLEQRLRQLEREWTGLKQSEAVADVQASAELQAQVEREAARLAGLRQVLRGGGTARRWADAKRPATRTDAYFEIAAQVERLRAAARARGVACRDDEQFGFADYREAGPEPEHIPVVLRQRQILDHLLTELFLLGPHQLDRVERSRPQGAATTDGRMATMGRDEFEPGGWTAALSGRSNPIAVRIAFTAQSEVLRRWLNRITEFDAPLVVRLVEVAPSEPRTDNRAALMDGTDGIVPVVPPGRSRFTVTVEYLEPVMTEETKAS